MNAANAAIPIWRRDGLSEDFIALTFDDGPAGWTDPIIETLAASHVHATFFVIGDAIPGRETTLKRTAESHEIGNHTLRHCSLTEIGPTEVKRELECATWAIEDVIGVAPSLFRPPGFEYDQTVLEVAGQCGFSEVIQSDVWMEDYNTTSPDVISDFVLRKVQRGSIIDLHDGRPPHEAPYPFGTREDRQPTAAAVEKIVPNLVQQGFKFVMVSELLVL